MNLANYLKLALPRLEPKAYDHESALREFEETLRAGLAPISAAIGKQPLQVDLEKVAREITQTWAQTDSLEQIGPPKLRVANWTVLSPDFMLRDNSHFAAAYTEAIARADRPRLVASLYTNFLLHYDPAISSFEAWRRGLQYSVQKAVSKSILSPTVRNEKKYRLLTERPWRHLSGLVDSPNALKTFLHDTGLGSGFLTQSRFLQRYTKAHCHEISTKPRLDADDFAFACRIITGPEGIRFEDSRPFYANTLLPPVGHRGSKSLDSLARKFFKEHYGDPRLERHRWVGVDEESQAVMRRLLVAESLDLFFRLIARHAESKHWAYREAFWKHYFGQEVIDDAWVALAPAAAAEVSGQDIGAFGKVQGGDQGQSGLIMRIGDLIVAERSHNGACCVWLAGDPASPEMHRSSYSGQSLRISNWEVQEGVRDRVSHQGSERGGWQVKLSSILHKRAGIAQPSYRHLMP